MPNHNNKHSVELLDPREAGPKPPYAEQKQPIPGTDSQMKPLADHGEDSYQGYDRMLGFSTLITGGDSGIGRAIAIAFAREGADVLLSFLPQEQRDAELTAEYVKDAGRKVVLAPGDLTDKQHCDQLVDRAFSEFGKLHVLVHNAAFQAVHQEVNDWTEEEFEHTYQTNVFAMFRLCRAALPRMTVGGSIINTASVQAYQPAGHLLAYSSTKGAIVTFTKALAELAIKQGVRVNAVAPGPVWTPLIPSTMPGEKVKHFGKQTLIGRAAQPAELAPAYVFLATNDARYVTGSVMDLTGGEMLP